MTKKELEQRVEVLERCLNRLMDIQLKTVDRLLKVEDFLSK